jgi:ubiquinol-cytochrome c reductase iron-sulfur subunit
MTRRDGAEPGRRAENAVLALLLVATAAAVAFVVLYVVEPDTQLLGIAIGVAFGLLAAASVLFGKRVVRPEQAVEEYGEWHHEQETADADAIVREVGPGVSRRRLLLGVAGAAGAALGAATLVPVASLGPNVGDKIRETPWSRGRRVVDTKGRPLTADDIEPGTFLTGLPEDADTRDLAASLILVQFPEEQLDLPPDRLAGAPEGILAFSKICTHAACAVSMYRHPLYEPTSPGPALVCPCHYSTFDPRRGARVIFGPAARPLPQLPLTIGPGRELAAAGDFFGQVGPSYSGVRLE